MAEEIKVQVSSGNVFADLGLENSDELLVKAELARKISSIITKQNMTQAEAAELLRIDETKVSALINGKLSNFSTVQMFRFLNALGRDIEIVVKTKLIRPLNENLILKFRHSLVPPAVVLLLPLEIFSFTYLFSIIFI